MRKILFFAAIAALALTAASCQKETPVQTEAPQELSLFAVSQTATKGYVTTTAFSEYEKSKLHESTDPTATDRAMVVSAYLKPTTTTTPSTYPASENASEAQNYFTGRTFTKGSESTPLWHATPAIYWPVGAKVDMLAYSVSTDHDFNPFDVEWDATNVASKVTIDVDESYTQDEILYCGVQDQTSASDGKVSMTFKRTQAWITFQLLASEADKVSIESVVMENGYNAGILTISNGSNPSASWNFNHEVKKNILIEDNNGLYCETPGGETGKYLSVAAASPSTDPASTYLDMLIPQQPMTSFVITYYFVGNTTPLKCRVTPASGTWNMGSHYKYKVTFTIKEMTIEPSVTAWTDESEVDVTLS